MSEEFKSNKEVIDSLAERMKQKREKEMSEEKRCEDCGCTEITCLLHPYDGVLLCTKCLIRRNW